MTSRMSDFAAEFLHRLAEEDDKLQEKFGDEALFVKNYVLSSEFKVKPAGDFVLASMMKLGIDSAVYIFGKNWLFITSEGPGAFFTSDNPVGLLTPDASPARGKHPLLDPRLEISIACSPGTALLIHSHTQSASHVAVSPNELEEMNRRVLPTVGDYGFAATKAQAEWILSELG